jgi:hypothetical protein
MSLKNENLISTRFVEDLIYSFNGSAHLKDLKSGKYIFSNEINAVNVGMYQAADLYGLTVRDLDRQMQQNWGDLATRIESFENQLRHQYKIILDDRQLSILPSGDLAIHNMKKYPILNSKNKIMGIVTLSELVTHQFDIFQQLEFYLTFYQSQGKKIAIQKFLNYLQIAVYFMELPTLGELRILLLKSRKSTAKVIAAQLFISPLTVETHLKRIRDKINTDINSLIERLNNP